MSGIIPSDTIFLGSPPKLWSASKRERHTRFKHFAIGIRMSRLFASDKTPGAATNPGIFQMTDFVKTAAFAAKASLALKGIKVQHGIALEVIAAFLGYKTYAALVVEENREDLKYHLADAEVIVLDYGGGVSRLTELQVLQAFIVQDFIDALVNCRDGVFSDLPELLDGYVQHELRDVILSDEGVIAAAGFEPFSIELEEGRSFSEPLWGASDTWEVSGFGTVHGVDDRADADDDDHDHDHEREEATRCFAWVKFSKAGRAGLKFQRSGGEFVER